MIYSVWNWRDGAYTYFEAPGEKLGDKPAVSKLGGGQTLQLEAALESVPSSARAIGKGRQARGRIATLHGSSAALAGYSKPEESPLVHSPYTTLGLGIAGLWLGYKILVALARRL